MKYIYMNIDEEERDAVKKDKARRKKERAKV